MDTTCYWKVYTIDCFYSLFLVNYLGRCSLAPESASFEMMDKIHSELQEPYNLLLWNSTAGPFTIWVCTMRLKNAYLHKKGQKTSRRISYFKGGNMIDVAFCSDHGCSDGRISKTLPCHGQINFWSVLGLQGVKPQWWSLHWSCPWGLMDLDRMLWGLFPDKMAGDSVKYLTFLWDWLLAQFLPHPRCGATLEDIAEITTYNWPRIRCP